MATVSCEVVVSVSLYPMLILTMRPVFSYHDAGAYVAAGSSGNGNVFVWNVDDGSLKSKLPGHTAGVCGFAWGRGGSSGQQVASVDRKGGLILWA